MYFHTNPPAVFDLCLFGFAASLIFLNPITSVASLHELKTLKIIH